MDIHGFVFWRVGIFEPTVKNPMCNLNKNKNQPWVGRRRRGRGRGRLRFGCQLLSVADINVAPVGNHRHFRSFAGVVFWETSSLCRWQFLTTSWSMMNCASHSNRRVLMFTWTSPFRLFVGLLHDVVGC